MKIDYNLMNIPGLLNRHFNDCSYGFQDGKKDYESLVWLDEIIEKPSLKRLHAIYKEEQRQQSMLENAMNDRAAAAREFIEHEKLKAQTSALKKSEQVMARVDKEVAQIRKDMEKKLEEIEFIKKKDAIEEYWYELSESARKSNDAAMEYLDKSNLSVLFALEEIFEKELRKALGDEIIDSRSKTKESIEEGQKVFRDYNQLIERDMPSKKEWLEAMNAGAKERTEMLKKIASLHAKYPKPTKPA